MNATTAPGTPDLHPEWDKLACRVLAEYDALRITTDLIREAEAGSVDPETGRMIGSRARSVAALYRSRMVTVLCLMKLGVPQGVLESVTR